MKTQTVILGTCLLVGAACGPKNTEQSNAAMFESYDKHHYDDMVSDHYEKDEDQGASISPEEMEFIQNTIEAYAGDFEHCLEKDMDEMENRWVAGTFAIEFDIGTDGKIKMAKMTESDVKERRTPNDKGEYVSSGGAAPRKAVNFDKCVETAVSDWEFDPPPEVEYRHTYNGKVGEAW